MTEATPSRAEALFARAQALSGEDREQFLRLECAGDEALRGEVERLLSAAVRAEDFFNDLSARLGVASLLEGKPMADAQAGAQVGAYRLIEPIGRGGMGTVWRAERCDGRFEGAVAIKFLQIQRGEAAERRFSLEGSYLARLVHPNIARLLDAGIDGEARPYLVIELVAGQAIDVHAERARLGIEARILLFLEVLAAVQHAHSNLIVHRDIKPSNVLVTADGTVKLLDFGVAKLLQDDETSAGAGLTRELGLALTPEYAAPEQIMGRPVTTATDVYALGLLLYRLLAGRHARSIETGDLQELMKLATATELPRVSEAATDTRTRSPADAQRIAADRATTPAALRKALQGDLDNIVAKALAAEPAERYSTAAEFAADLRRYLAHEPVTAQPQTVAYRVSKFVRRHRGSVAASLLIAFGLIATSAVAVWQLAEARAQRDRAIYQQRRVQANNEFMGLLFQELPKEGALTPRQLLDRASSMLDQQYGAGDPFLGHLLLEVSRRYGQVGAPERETGLLLRAEGIGREHRDDDTLATALCRLAYAQFAADPAAIRARVEEAKAVLARIHEPSMDSIESCARAEALMLAGQKDPEGSVRVLQRAHDTVAANPASSVTLASLLAVEIAFHYANMGNFAEAIPRNEQVLSALERAGHSNTFGYLQVLANQAIYYGAVGEYQREAETWERIKREAARVDRPDEALIVFNSRHALSLAIMMRTEESLALLRGNREKLAGRNNPRELGLADLYMAGTLVFAERYAEAAELVESAERIFSINPGAFARELNSAVTTRAEIAAGTGHAAEGLALMEAELSKMGYPQDRASPSLIPTLRRATRVALQAGAFSLAEQWATDGHALTVKRARATDSNGMTGLFLLRRAQARQALGNTAGALADARGALPPLTNGFGADHPWTGQARDLAGRP